jgi:hypothetical protein
VSDNIPNGYAKPLAARREAAKSESTFEDRWKNMRRTQLAAEYARQSKHPKREQAPRPLPRSRTIDIPPPPNPYRAVLKDR